MFVTYCFSTEEPFFILILILVQSSLHLHNLLLKYAVPCARTLALVVLNLQFVTSLYLAG
jgi:hypothetical protein